MRNDRRIQQNPTPAWSIYLTTFVGILGSIILIYLGSWQLDRYEWKQEILNRMRQAPHESPVSVLEVNSNTIEKYEFKRVHVVGQWGKGYNFYVVGRVHRTQVGYHLLGIVQLPNKMNMLVNFGWVGHKHFLARQPQKADFIGRVRLPTTRSWFMPKHRPHLQEFIMVDVKAIEAATGIKLLPYYVDYVREDTGRQPFPVPELIRVSDNHFGYAMTWFILAVFWTVGFIRLVWVSRRAVVAK